MLVYADNASTTQLDKRVYAAMAPYYTDIYGNASSLHVMGRKALAAADGIELPEAELRRRALQWAMWQKHNGHSGRTARQFVNSLSAALKEVNDEL